MATLSRLRACIAQRDALGAKTLEAFGSLSLSESQERNLFRELLPLPRTVGRPENSNVTTSKTGQQTVETLVESGPGRFAKTLLEGSLAGELKSWLLRQGKQGLLAWVTSRDKRQKQPWKVAYNQLLVFLGLAWVFLGSCADGRTHYQRSDSTRSRVSTSAAKAWLQLMGL
ncbi:hypothetical protein CDV31_014377 [Fusarium ambrosium]|uniref:Uncharacterized protein n=1 Tax=Fusarium ambrosium TaxID=131363 RepID=A0A428SWZ5_9HYPO|nr:hypothetical protein CDV31_014377 [Fusarium ambrosium]